MVSSIFIAATLSALPMAFANYYQYPNSTLVQAPCSTAAGVYATGSTATAAYAPGPTGTGTASPHVQTVSVGKDGLVFTPDTIHAKVGEEITFQFFPKNHSVVQADFNNPCNPSENGIFSGFFPTPAPGPSNKTFTITVKDDKPIWLYCSALKPKPHCAAGMVAVINPPKTGPKTLDAFRAAAKQTTNSTSPATPNGGDVESPKPSGSATTTSEPATFTGAASSLVLSSGAIGVVAVVFALFI